MADRHPQPLLAALVVLICTLSSLQANSELAFTDTPPAFTNATLATFSFSWNGHQGSTECRLDSSPLWSACSSPHTIHVVSEGEHELWVRAVGHDGNLFQGAIISTRWVVDTSPPVVSIISGPAPATPRPSAKFVFSVTDMPQQSPSGLATVLCWLDGTSLDSCNSPLSLTGLGPSAHHFRVEGVDAAGNTAASEDYSWHIRSTPRARIAIASDDARCRGALPLAIEWSEAVDGFSANSVVIGGVGGQLRDWNPDPQRARFFATLHPNASGEVIVELSVGSTRSAAGEVVGEVPEPLRLSCDLVPPSVSVMGPSGSRQLDGPFAITFSWSEVVSRFSADHILLSGLPGAWLEPSWTLNTVASRFRATVHPVGSGTLALRVSAGAAEDAMGNPNTFGSEELQLRVTGGHIATADSKGRVAVYSAGMKQRGSAWSLAVSAPGLLAAHPDGRLFGAVRGGSSLQVFDVSGQLLQTIAGFQAVAGMTCAGSGELYVADSAERRVAVMDAQLIETGSLRAAAMQSPTGLAVDGAGQLYVADAEAGAVLLLDPSGALLTSISFPYRRQSDSSACPTSVEVDGRKRLYVACEGVPSVEMYVPTTSNALLFTHVASLDLPAAARPAALALDRLGQLYVADAAGNGLIVGTVDEGLVAQPPAAASPLVAVAIFRDRSAPVVTIQPPGTREQSGPFQLRISWSEPVTGFNVSCIQLSGVGGHLGGLEALDEEVFEVTVTPSAVGMLEVQVESGCGMDGGGNVNLQPSNRIQVVYFGGQCSVNLGCRWRLAEYESQLAEKRLRLSVDLEAEKERVKMAVQQAAEDARAARALEAEAQAQQRELQARRELAEIEAGVVAQRAAAEAEGRIREARENEDVRLRELAAAGRQRREVVLASIAAVTQFLEAAGSSVLSEPGRLRSLVAAFGAAVLTFFVARETVRVLGQEIARLLSKPPLIRETSRTWLATPAALIRRLVAIKRPPDAEKLASLFGDVVLAEKLHNEVEELAQSVALATSRGVPLRNVLLWGPPGTGKTMAAQRLARGCGLGYAMMSGGDVVPLGKDAVSELHKIFDWAERNSKGVLLFIDEADAFLRRRQPGDGDSATSEQTRAAINAVLARTGSQSSRFMMVLASNRPEDLDAAVLDRIDDTICFPLPGVAEREAMLQMYFKRYIGRISPQVPSIAHPPNPPTWQWWRSRAPTVHLRGFDKATMRRAAEITEGFSGRELAKLMAYVQSTVYGWSPDTATGRLSLTASQLMEMVQRKVAEHRQKASFITPHPQSSSVSSQRSN